MSIINFSICILHSSMSFIFHLSSTSFKADSIPNSYSLIIICFIFKFIYFSMTMTLASANWSGFWLQFGVQNSWKFLPKNWILDWPERNFYFHLIFMEFNAEWAKGIWNFLTGNKKQFFKRNLIWQKHLVDKFFTSQTSNS